ncbi:hypothetical protein U1Q18_015969 [Sarracenia purpurea var. burkii]
MPVKIEGYFLCHTHSFLMLMFFIFLIELDRGQGEFVLGVIRSSFGYFTGIEKVEVDGNSQKVVITGYAQRNKILKAVRRSGLKADFWSAQYELLNAYATHGSFRFNNFSFF